MSRRNAGIHPGDSRIKLAFPLIFLFVAGINSAAAQVVPLPRPRPDAAPTSQIEEGPSACRLTSELAIAPTVSNHACPEV